MAIILNALVNTTVDESNLLQNPLASFGVAGDDDDNDITVAAINGTPGDSALPDPFEARLFELFGNVATTPLQVALSGFDGTNAGTSETDLLSVDAPYSDLLFTDGDGFPLAGGDSGLFSIDGTPIFLYTDTNNNIVLGRKGTLVGLDYVADPAGAIVLAAYLDETQTATGGTAKVWTVLFEPLKHPTGGTTLAAHDDAVDLTDYLYVSATTDIDFPFAGLPSGQNEFLMFKAPNANVGLIVTGLDPDKVVNGKVNGDTVNTSQGGGPTSIGTNNQSVDPPTKSGAPGEGMIFTFVTDPDPLYTVPNLTHDEATTEANILYGTLFGATGATIDIAQQTPPKASTAKISAYNTALEKGTDYYEGLITDGDGAGPSTADVLAYISSVTVLDANGDAIDFSGLETVTNSATSTDGSIVVTFTNVNLDSDPTTFEARTVTIGGFLAGYSLEYTTDGVHNRVLIENVGGPKGSSPFDIGGFHLPSSSLTTEEIGSHLGFEDDGPKLVGTGSATVDEDGLTVLVGGSAGIAGGPGDFIDGNADGDNNEATAGGLLSTIFSAGNDGLSTFGLDDTAINNVKAFDTAAVEVALTSKGDSVSYDVIGNTLWGFVDVGGTTEYQDGTDRAVFRLDLTNVTDAATAAYTFTLLDQLDHPATEGGDDSENELVLHLGSVLKVTDKDGDSVLGNAANLVITVDDDTPTATGTAVTDAVDEDGLTGGNVGGTGDLTVPDDDFGATGDGSEATTTGSIAGIFQSGADEPLTFGLAQVTTGVQVFDSVGGAVALKSKGGTVQYDVVGNTLWGFVDVGGVATEYEGGTDRAVFSLTLTNPTVDGSYAFALLDQLDHPETVGGDDSENELLLHLGSVLQAADYDDDTVTAAANKLVITVDDDTPIGFTPDSITLENTGTDFGTEPLNSENKVGADEDGTIVFVDSTPLDNFLYDTSNGGGKLQSGGKDIVLSGYTTDTLLAQIETAPGVFATVFTATLDDATHQYTIAFERTIDDGGGISFLGAAPVKSGNPTYNVINNVGGTPLDLLFSGGDVDGGAPTSHSVNVSTNGAGTDNQSMNAGETLRIDFTVGASLTGSPNGSDFVLGTHQTVNGYSFLLSQNTPSGTTGTMFIQAFDADNDKILVGDTGVPPPNSTTDVLDPITKVTVNGLTVVENGVVTDKTINGHLVTAYIVDGGIVLTGLNEGQTGDGTGGDDPVIKVFTGDGFNRVEVSNYAGESVDVNGTPTVLGGTSFDIAPAGVDLAVQGTTFSFELEVQMTDYDGDSGPVEVIGVTVDPVPV